MARFPRIFLWVWERAEDLRFINPDEVGLAILAQTVIVEQKGLTVRPRMQPVQYPPGACTIAVVRVETRPSPPAKPAPELRERIVKEIISVIERGDSKAVKVDFDALRSERSFYRYLLMDFRVSLPPNVKVSMTALASWCIGDDWISNLPVDEAVPMLFRLGVDHDLITRRLRSGMGFRDRICKYSAGVSTDEIPPRLGSGLRVYVFSPERWTKDSVKDALKLVREIQ